MAETDPAPAAPVPAKAPKKKTAAKPKKSGPSVSELIVKAVSASKERSGLSVAALKKILQAGGYDVEKNNSLVNRALKSLVTKETLLQTKGTGASGSFKLNKKAAEAKEKAAKKKAAAPKKPAAKKAVVKKTTKKVSAKKAATPKKSPKKATKPKAVKNAPKSPKKAAAKPKKVVKKSPKKAKAAPKPKRVTKAAKPAAKKAAPKKK
ncbi:histone H1-like [Acipenser ruthenus]|uniref:histone H1-like n=1 Tax=Acipenser ruthenus TaxID=7906 RepID=UPI0027403A04|nr:histone H1-like [Acipenser ruthenus]